MENDLKNDLKTDLTSLVLDAKSALSDQYHGLVALCLDKLLARIESAADQPAPATPKVRILLDDDGYAAATTSIEMDVVFLDCNIPLEDKGKAFKKAAKAFYSEYNHLPHQYRP